jgi:hypothetical protein
VAGVRLDMLGRGFALVDTPPFDDRLSDQLRRRRTTLRAGDSRWWKFPQLARYGCWLEALLRRALPEEAISLAALEFRHERAGLVDEEVDGLHADGSYIRSARCRAGAGGDRLLVRAGPGASGAGGRLPPGCPGASAGPGRCAARARGKKVRRAARRQPANPQEPP